MVLHHRRDKIDRIQARIDQLYERAGELLAAEYDQRARLDDLRREMEQSPAARLRSRRRSRALRRAERVTEALRTKREFLVEEELRSIMMALEKQSRRTRERLDEELERLAPVEVEWERLRLTFDALEMAVAAPALEPLAGQLGGVLEIPEFPVREREGYARPFPTQALLF